MRECTSCKELKPLSDFSTKNGKLKQSKCKPCFKDFARNYRIINKDAISAKRKAKYQDTKELVAQRKKDYYIRNRSKIVKKVSAYAKIKLKTDLEFKLKRKIRDRFNKALKGNYKRGSAIIALGCSIDFLKKYLESKFQDGMNWENYGSKGWHIDHKIPLSKFDLQDPLQIARACHYTNLQPLWASDNLKKSNK